MKDNIDLVVEAISRSAARSGRDPAGITLVAVSKKQSVEKMLAYADYCASRGVIPVFGESYLQEYQEKRSKLEGVRYKVHMIGRLQSNKVKDSVEFFDVIESVASRKLADKINSAAIKAGKSQAVYIQVNISNDPSKAGFLPEECIEFFNSCVTGYSNLTVCGLMTITQMYDNPELAREDFRKLRELRERISAQSTFSAPETSLELSMGMSADFDIAIEEGATVIRIGTALFGERN